MKDSVANKLDSAPKAINERLMTARIPMDHNQHNRVMRGAECRTDHQLVITKMVVQLKQIRKHAQHKTKKLDVASLCTESSKKHLEDTMIRKLQEHQATVHTTIEEEWASLRYNVLAAAKGALGMRKRGSSDRLEPHREVIDDLFP